jgi:MFS family permease
MQNKKFYPWLVVGLLWVVATLNYLDRQMLSTMRPSMQQDIAELAKAENFGRLMAIFLWIYAFMSPISGIIADRLNRKWLIVGSLFVWSGVTLAMGYARTFDELYILRAVMGVSEAFYMPAGLALIADYHQGKTRSIAIGIHLSGVYLGQAFGGFGATIASASSWQWTFHSFGFLGVAYSLVLMLLLKEKKGYDVDATKNATIEVKSGQNLKTGNFFVSTWSELKKVWKGLVILFTNIAFWVILFNFSAPSFPGWAVKNWLPTLFSDALHLDMSKAGPIATITTAMSSLVGVLLGGYLSDRWVLKTLKGRIYTGIVGMALTIPALFLLGYGGSFEMILLGGIFFGLGFGMFDVNNMPILCQFVSPRYRATGYGIMNLAGISAGAVITAFLGKSADAGNMRHDFAMLSVAVVAAIALNLLVLNPKTVNKTED